MAHEDELPVDEPPGDEANWNPMDWDRAAEDITWERLLGLDGSLVFLEHVFWVISLNTLFILIFAFCPYHIGHGAIIFMGLREQATASNFEGLVTTLCGYCIIAICFVTLHHFAGLFGLRKSRRILGLGYVVVKVSLLSVVEIGVLPLICGWWLDICSLAMFDATLKDREHSFRVAPGTSMFLHWLVGMVYVYYFASFILLLREVLRPGVLWFLRNLNDPDFSPIQVSITQTISFKLPFFNFSATDLRSCPSLTTLMNSCSDKNIFIIPGNDSFTNNTPCTSALSLICNLRNSSTPHALVTSSYFTCIMANISTIHSSPTH